MNKKLNKEGLLSVISSVSPPRMLKSQILEKTIYKIDSVVPRLRLATVCSLAMFVLVMSTYVKTAPSSGLLAGLEIVPSDEVETILLSSSALTEDMVVQTIIEL